MDMKQLCKNQAQQAKIYKWLEGEKLGYDPGDEAIHKWVKNYAASYRERYNNTYKLTVDQVKENASERIDSIVSEHLSTEKKEELVKYICDTFTEVWVKEVATDNNDNPHLEEI